MKKKKKNHSKLFLAVIPAAVILTAGSFFIYSHFSSREEDPCAENTAILKALESADISQTEARLKELKSHDKTQAQEFLENGGLLSDVEIKQAFSGSVILGDSITESIVEYGFLDTDVVISKRGLCIHDADEQIETAIGLHPAVIFMAFGSNDLELYEGDSKSFIAAYRTQVQKLKDALPDAPIYINGILPLLDSAIEEIPSLGYYPQFNEALEAFCTEMGCTYIDTSYLVQEDASMYEPDGEHVVRDYYPKWLTYMAETAGL